MNPETAHPAAVPDLLTRADVAALLGVPLKKLTFLAWGLREERRYTRFEIKKHNGGTREIHSPTKALKDVQRNLARLLLSWYRGPNHVHGFVADRGPLSNARQHQRQRWLLKVDLLEFFPSVHFGRVRGVFSAFPFGYPPDVCTLLAALCCHEQRLPQGAPTSPILTNFICRGMDKELAELARTERCFYTRYADDLSFSTDRSVFPSSVGFFDGGVARPGAALERIISHHDFRINPAKTQLRQRGQRHRVTGLVVNEKANTPREYTRSLRNLLFIWKAHGRAAAEEAFARAGGHLNWPPEKPNPSFELVVRGRVQYVGSVRGWSSKTYGDLSTALASVDPTFRPTSRTPPDGQIVRIYTEGPSDILHLRSATQYFHERQEFLDLRPIFPDDYVPKNDKALAAHCTALSISWQDVPAVCVFDRDRLEVLRDEVGQQDWRDRGRGVVALALVPPPWRGNEVCIEMLYRDRELLRPDTSGRRIFLREEFHNESGHHLSGPYTVTNPKRQGLVVDEVFKIGTEGSVAKSKMSFAKEVAAKTMPYADIDFEGFRPTFEVLRDAVGRAAAVIRQHGYTSDTPRAGPPEA